MMVRVFMGEVQVIQLVLLEDTWQEACSLLLEDRATEAEVNQDIELHIIVLSKYFQRIFKQWKLKNNFTIRQPRVSLSEIVTLFL